MCVEIRDGYRTCCASARRAPTGNERTLDARSAGSLGHRARRVTRARAAGFARPHASTTRSPSLAARALATFVSPPRLVRPGRSRDPRRPAALAREMASLRESRGALRLGDAPDAPALGFEATAPIQLPDASRPLPPASASDGDAVSVPADVPSKLRGWALALALGRALPPAPPTPDGTTAPVAWHPHTPRLATVDRTGRVLIHADPAAPRAPRAPPSALRHSLHAGARALVATQRRRHTRRRRRERRLRLVPRSRRAWRRRRRTRRAFPRGRAHRWRAPMAPQTPLRG